MGEWYAGTGIDRSEVGITRRGVIKGLGGAGIAAIIAGTPALASASRKSPLKAASDGSIAELLRLVPTMPLSGIQLDYSDYARQRAALGLSASPPSESETDAQLDALSGMAFSFVGDFSAPEWRYAFGFTFADIDELLELRTEGVSLTILRGRFDERRLERAWRSAGFAPRTTGDTTYFSAGDDWEFDIVDPVSSLHLARFNNLLLLNSSTLVASATQSALDEVVRLQAVQGSSFAGFAIVGALLSALPSDLVTATLLDGRSLQPALHPAMLAENQDIPATEREVLNADVEDQIADAPRMPPIALVLAGATAGRSTEESAKESGGTGVPVARSIVAAFPVNPNSIEVAATVAADRLEVQSPLGTGYADDPYVDLYTQRGVEVVPGQPVLRIDLVPAPGTSPTLARDLLLTQNLTFLYWIA